MCTRISDDNQRVQKNCYEMLKTRFPKAAEREILKMVLESRLAAPPQEGELPSQAEIEDLMSGIQTLDDLCDYIVLSEAKHALPDPLGLAEMVEEILAGERRSKDRNGLE